MTLDVARQHARFLQQFAVAQTATLIALQKRERGTFAKALAFLGKFQKC